jgi:DNA excision repair protein ERCC-8
MNVRLFERSSGSLGPNGFARIQTASLLRSFSAAPRLRFDGGERAADDTAGHASSSTSAAGADTGSSNEASRASLWAHQAGVSALALERFDGRM